MLMLVVIRISGVFDWVGMVKFLFGVFSVMILFMVRWLLIQFEVLLGSLLVFSVWLMYSLQLLWWVRIVGLVSEQDCIKGICVFVFGRLMDRCWLGRKFGKGLLFLGVMVMCIVLDFLVFSVLMMKWCVLVYGWIVGLLVCLMLQGMVLCVIELLMGLCVLVEISVLKFEVFGFVCFSGLQFFYQLNLVVIIFGVSSVLVWV